MNLAFTKNIVFLYSIFVWSIIWIGFALWKTVKNNQRNWFIALLILNTAGILEILYLFHFAKKPMKLQELKFWRKTK